MLKEMGERYKKWLICLMALILLSILSWNGWVIGSLQGLKNEKLPELRKVVKEYYYDRKSIEEMMKRYLGNQYTGDFDQDFNRFAKMIIKEDLEDQGLRIE